MLAQAPFDFWPVLFVTFPVLVWLLDHAPPQRMHALRPCAQLGWCFGFGYFTFGFYWIGHALLVDADTFGWLLPFAVTAVPAFIALFPAGGVVLAGLVWSRGPSRILA